LKAGVDYHKGVFPSANSRARANGSMEGVVKVLADAKTDKTWEPTLLPNAGEMIALRHCY
jgi:dihydrolipoamide dehydrogenase